jgi:hypothetical protein
MILSVVNARAYQKNIFLRARNYTRNGEINRWLEFSGKGKWRIINIRYAELMLYFRTNLKRELTLKEKIFIEEISRKEVKKKKPYYI